jgi:hypothetical protein
MPSQQVVEQQIKAAEPMSVSTSTVEDQQPVSNRGGAPGLLRQSLIHVHRTTEASCYNEHFGR